MIERGADGDLWAPTTSGSATIYRIAKGVGPLAYAALGKTP